MKTRRMKPIAVVALGLVMLGLISVAQAQAYTILVYGRDSCGYTLAMRNFLDDNKYRYSYYDVMKDDAKLEEMWNKVDKVCPTCRNQGSVQLPVVDVSGSIFIRPTEEQVKQAAGKP